MSGEAGPGQPLLPHSLFASPTLWEYPNCPALSTRPGWGPGVGAGPGASWRAAGPHPCWPFPFIAPCIGLGPRPRGSDSFGGLFSAGGEQTTPPPQPRDLPKAPSMSSRGWNAIYFIGERFVPRTDSCPRWKASSYLKPSPQSSPLPSLLPALLVTLLFTLHPIPNLKYGYLMPLGQDSLPQLCLLSSSWQASWRQRKTVPSGMPFHVTAQARTGREDHSQCDSSMCLAFPSASDVQDNQLKAWDSLNGGP